MDKMGQTHLTLKRNPFYDWSLTEKSQDAIIWRLNRIERSQEILRHEIGLLEAEKETLQKVLTRPAVKPTIVKAAVVSIVSVECHICGKKTTNKVNGKFECRDHSIVSRMSELQRRVLNDMMNGIQ